MLPPVVCLALSIALHAAALRGMGASHPPDVQLEMGRTVVHLTLQPAQAGAARQPEPVAEITPEPEPEPIPEKTPEPAPAPAIENPAEPVAEPAPAPEPEPAAIEQLASLIPSKGVETEASVQGTFRPTYPRISQRRNEEGTVRIAVEVSVEGTASRTEIVQSSGYPRLDQAALEAARNAAFTPALRAGRPVSATTELTFTFRLTDD